MNTASSANQAQPYTALHSFKLAQPHGQNKLGQSQHSFGQYTASGLNISNHFSYDSFHQTLVISILHMTHLHFTLVISILHMTHLHSYITNHPKVIALWLCSPFFYYQSPQKHSLIAVLSILPLPIFIFAYKH